MVRHFNPYGDRDSLTEYAILTLSTSHTHKNFGERMKALFHGLLVLALSPIGAALTFITGVPIGTIYYVLSRLYFYLGSRF